ncbi:MAG TPA: hypothetical protein VME41_18520 [Stellaceae bacterium]|nr:hypothetical protein [Stellaceae bacterium]
MTAEARAARWLAAWDEQGVHRTATAGDTAGADWLAAEAAALGAEVAIEEFALDRLDPVETFLDIGDRCIAAVPVFDAPATSDSGVGGRLGLDIAVAEFTPRAVYGGEYERLRRAGGHRALVIVCAGEASGMGLLNAENFRAPYGAPAIHIASEACATVREAAARHAPARLVAASRRSVAVARNVVIRLAGGAPEAEPLIVMTPRSSWWQSTAERGGGIVCWLEALRALLAASPRRPVIFTANSGHELGHLGLDDFVARRPGCEARAIWLHWGANLGAAGGALAVMSASKDLREAAAAELTHAGQSHALAPPHLVPSGETRDIHRKGGRYLTLVGSNPLFHLPQDRWPDAVDVAAVARIAAAASRIAVALAADHRI